MRALKPGDVLPRKIYSVASVAEFAAIFTAASEEFARLEIAAMGRDRSLEDPFAFG
ncbi:MAG: hypothetical protein ACKVX7_05650 [Planctomycetota bacterium]